MVCRVSFCVCMCVHTCARVWILEGVLLWGYALVSLYLGVSIWLWMNVCVLCLELCVHLCGSVCLWGYLHVNLFVSLSMYLCVPSACHVGSVSVSESEYVKIWVCVACLCMSVWICDCVLCCICVYCVCVCVRASPRVISHLYFSWPRTWTSLSRASVSHLQNSTWSGGTIKTAFIKAWPHAGSSVLRVWQLWHYTQAPVIPAWAALWIPLFQSLLFNCTSHGIFLIIPTLVGPQSREVLLSFSFEQLNVEQIHILLRNTCIFF